MHHEIETLLNQAENRYLSPEEINNFKHHVATLAQRLKVYEFLREKEAVIFQPIANKLITAFPDEKSEVLERSLKQWILILRLSAMAMLLNDSNYLKQHLADWLDSIVIVHQTQKLELTIYEFLQDRLQEVVSSQALALLKPFLDGAQILVLKA